MIYLLDTNAISDLMRGSLRIENWIAGLPQADRLVTCAIVRGEILFGVGRLPEGKRRTELEDACRQFLGAFRCEAIPQAAADHYAELKLGRQRSGLVLDENDLWVAATALALSATLVSRDSDFTGVEGLTLLNLDRE
jgi:predicted nucleic acid-binding protein